MNAFYACKANKPFSKAGAASYPSHGPLCLVLHTGDCVYGLEQVLPLSCIPDEMVQQQAVHLTVDILNRNLEAIERSGLC